MLTRLQLIVYLISKHKKQSRLHLPRRTKIKFFNVHSTRNVSIYLSNRNGKNEEEEERDGEAKKKGRTKIRE